MSTEKWRIVWYGDPIGVRSIQVFLLVTSEVLGRREFWGDSASHYGAYVDMLQLLCSLSTGQKLVPWLYLIMRDTGHCHRAVARMTRKLVWGPATSFCHMGEGSCPGPKSSGLRGRKDSP